MPAARTTTQIITSPGGTSPLAELTTPYGDPATAAEAPSVAAAAVVLGGR